MIKNLPDRVSQHELIEVFEDTFQIRLVSKDGMSERYVFVPCTEKEYMITEFHCILPNHSYRILEKEKVVIQPFYQQAEKAS